MQPPVVCIGGVFAVQAAESDPEGRIVTDMRGKEVTIPENLERVAILDKGFLVQSMVALGVEDKICSTGGLITEAGDPEERDSLYLFPVDHGASDHWLSDGCGRF